MNFNFSWIKYDPDNSKVRLPEYGEWILCLRIDGDQAITFEGYFHKDPNERYDYVFITNDDKAIDGESIEIDYWVPMTTVLPKG